MISTFKGTAFSNMSLLRLAGALLVITGVAHAEPYMAVRTGMKCSQCHLNKIGGGGRTDYGQAYTQYQLVMKQTQEAIRSGREEGLSSFDPKLNEAVTIGANLRMEEFARLNAETSNDTADFSADADNELAFSEANVYINVELVKNFLSFYTDMNLGASSGSREIWMMARNLPFDSYVKVGKTLLPYGLRLMDDRAFIRDKTRYTYNNPDVAGEIGVEPGPVSAIVNVTNSRVSSVGYVTYRHFRVGGSYGTVYDGAKFDTYGPFVGANFGRFTALAEVDFITQAATTDTLPDIKQVAQFYEVNFLPMQGVNLKTTFEYFDRNTEIANSKDGQSRWTFGAETFPVQFLQLGLYYRLNQFIPQNPAANQDIIIGRAHVFF